MPGWLGISAALAGSRRRFAAALGQPERRQQAQLAQILRTGRDTALGRRLGLASLNGCSEYRERVPIHDYDSLRADIEAMARGEGGEICQAPLFFERTGGSTAGPKLIPFNRAGLAALQRALHPWLADLIGARPGITRGRAYWSLSPAARRPQTTAGGIPLGAASDAAYFGEPLCDALLTTLVTPPGLGAVESVALWRHVTLVHLLGAQDLSLISVWSPTFLLQLLAGIADDAEALIRAIHDGRLSPRCPAAQHERLAPRCADPGRARLIERALASGRPDTALLWPRLDTISCWTHASAAAHVPALRERFPQVPIQGKGLLSTEGVVSIPWCGARAPVLAVDSGFYEFLDPQGTSRLCTELADGETYRVIMTTHAGLYRYDTGDLVRVEGWLRRTPMLRFVGRAGVVSDLCGEKLTEAFVNGCLGGVAGFRMLTPDGPDPAAYRLYVDAGRYDRTKALALARQLDRALCANPQYRYARRIGQLGALRVSRVSRPTAAYVDHHLRRGRVLGDIKPPALSAERGWAGRFAIAP